MQCQSLEVRLCAAVITFKLICRLIDRWCHNLDRCQSPLDWRQSNLDPSHCLSEAAVPPLKMAEFLLTNNSFMFVLSQIFFDAKLLTHTSAASPSPSPSSHSSSPSFISGEGTIGSTLDLKLKGTKVFNNKYLWHG